MQACVIETKNEVLYALKDWELGEKIVQKSENNTKEIAESEEILI